MTDPTPQSRGPVAVPTWFKAGAMVGSLALGLVLAELVIRAGSGGALPHLRLFAQDGPTIALQPDRCADVRHATGTVYAVCTGPDALRRAGPPTAPLVVGDSQVLGMGVPDGATFAALSSWRNGGVPGHGVADALAHADALDPPAPVIVVVNQANDWEEGLTRAGDRYRVTGGLLLRSTSANPVGRAFWSSPLSRLQLLAYVALLASAPRVAPDAAPPAWLADPGGQAGTSHALADAIDAFADRHPTRPVLVAFLPVDVAVDPARVATSPFGRHAAAVAPAPWQDRQLRDQLSAGLDRARFVDLTPTLEATPGAFLDADYHLSPAGHAAVARALQRALAP